MRWKQWMGALVVFAGAGVPAGAQSFNCEQAQTGVEKAVCANKQVSAADEALAAQYKLELAEAPPEVQTELRAIQRKWLAQLPDHCKESVAKMPVEKCLLLEYTGEKAELERHVMRKGGVLFVLRHKTLLAKDGSDDMENKSAEEHPGFGTINASWPEALTYPAAQAGQWKAWNVAVLRQIQRMAGASAKDGPGWKQTWAEGVETDLNAALGAVGRRLVSVDLTAETMGHGAAHPYESSETFHWLLVEQRPLRTGDVFKPGWQTVVTARCRAALKQQIGDVYAAYAGAGQPGEFAKTLLGVVTDVQNWEINAKGVTINFPEYSVTARVDPVEPVLVPWTAVQGFLVPGFVSSFVESDAGK